jgi:hypothetical protein
MEVGKSYAFFFVFVVFFLSFFASLSSSAVTQSATRPNAGSFLSMPRIAGPTIAAAVANPSAFRSVTPAR